MLARQYSLGFIDRLIQHSQALALYLSQHPKYANDVKKAEKKEPPAIIKHFQKKFLKKENARKNLHHFKYSTLSALTSKYLDRSIDTETFCRAWSQVADICCEVAYQWAMRDTVTELGEPEALDDNNNKIDFSFTIIAVGKLGSEELNLSSDIDLIYLYNTDNGQVGNKSLNEFASKLSTKITSILSTFDESRFCFRVDTDLRPEGKSGPIANSVDAAIRFYNYWGGEMERMMLIRARPIAGNLELGEKFIQQIRPFIFRKSIDINSLGKIKETKLKIQSEATKSLKKGINIKTGDGGIREVEFVVQAIQLVNGARNPEIIEQNTFRAIKAIRKGKYLTDPQCRDLNNAYIFLRDLENMIQLPEEKQTHILPTSTNERTALAKAMRYDNTDAQALDRCLMTDFDRHTGAVKQLFRLMFEADLDRQQMEEAILTNIATCTNEEEEIDSLAWFKNEELRQIQFLDLEKNFSSIDVSERLSLVAEVIVSEAYKLASHRLREIHGPPLTDKAGHPTAGLAIIGMGKLGGREIDYASDLDLMFIYSEEGTTAGPKKISNREYFTKLSQRIISLITLPTRYGHAYQIDADLRPSGRAGVLVSALQTFQNYHNVEAMFWERQTLIKARPIAGDPQFLELVGRTIKELCFEAIMPPNFKKEIFDLRIRMEEEKAKEKDDRPNVKLGHGGLMDIEMIVQYLELRYGTKHPEVRQTNTLSALEKLTAKGLIDDDDAEILRSTYLFYKHLLSRIRLFSHHATDYLDPKSEHLSQIAETLGFQNKNVLVDEYRNKRKTIRKIYDKYLRPSQS